MSQKFHCKICENVGGKDGAKFKCAKHSFICSDCVDEKGFFSTKYLCKDCGKETIKYEWNKEKAKWAQA